MKLGIISMFKINTILFDMDGVLIDAKEWHFQALNEALKLFGEEISVYEHHITYDGLPTKEKLKMLSQMERIPTGLHSIISFLKQKKTLEIGYSRLKPNFLHLNALKELKSKGYNLAVCSNSVRKTVDLFLDRAEILSFFDFTLSNEDVSKPKPDPEIYIKAMKKFGVEPIETLILEDNEHGIKAARDSGAHVLEINSVSDVSLSRILNKISYIEGVN
jgi:beta-phosphoglucomutase